MKMFLDEPDNRGQEDSDSDSDEDDDDSTSTDGYDDVIFPHYVDDNEGTSSSN